MLGFDKLSSVLPELVTESALAHLNTGTNTNAQREHYLVCHHVDSINAFSAALIKAFFLSVERTLMCLSAVVTLL